MYLFFRKPQYFSYKLYFKNKAEYKELFNSGRNKLFLATLRKVYKSKDLQGLFVRFIPSAAEISNANDKIFGLSYVYSLAAKKKMYLTSCPDSYIRTDAYKADEYNGRCTRWRCGGAVRYIKAEERNV